MANKAKKSWKKVLAKTCENSPSGGHEMGCTWRVTQEGDELVLWFPCRHCGLMGRLTIKPKEIEW